MIPGTIMPWLLGGLLILTCSTLAITYKSWRESKRSPYFFLRLQAARKMQNYMVASAGLSLVTIATTAYGWHSPEDRTLRVAVLAHAKPDLSQASAAGPEEVLAPDAAPDTIEISLSSFASSVDNGAPDLLAPSLAPVDLPDEYNQIEPEVELTAEAQLTGVAFSTDITDAYEAVRPSRRFAPGFYTLYATFAYEGMVDGLTWSWVWRHNGQAVDGGNQSWSYGQKGPGYVYFRPEDGFQLGQYTFEMWVNGELATQANVMVTEGIAASN